MSLLELWRLSKAQATAHIFVHVAQAHVPLLKQSKKFSSSSTPNFDPTHRPIARVIHKIR